MAKATADLNFPASGDNFTVANFKNAFNAMQQMDSRPLRPRAHAPANLSISVEGAVVESFYSQVYTGLNRVTKASGDTPTMVAPSTQPRIDTIFVTATGDFGIAQGAEAATPVIPTIPAGSGDVLPVCHIYHKVAETAILNYEDRGTSTGDGYILRDVRPMVGLQATLLDEDNMTSNSSLKGATQQSIKAYVDAFQAETHVFNEQTSDPTTTANQGVVYTKESGDQAELIYRGESNADIIQLTEDGQVRRNQWSLFGRISTATISSGVLTITTPIVKVNGQGGSADTLDTVSGPPAGAMIILLRGDADITVSDGTGNLRMAGNFTLDHTDDTIVLSKLTESNDAWREISRSSNA